MVRKTLFTYSNTYTTTHKAYIHGISMYCPREREMERLRGKLSRKVLLRAVG